MDSSWDNGGHDQAPKSGLPTWAKILMGCGAVGVLLVGGCAVGSAVLARRGFEKVANDPEIQAEVARAMWPEFRRVAEPLKDDAGARTFYRQHPALARRFPTEESFVAAERPWQGAFADLPATPPAAEAFRVQVSFLGVAASYRPAGGKWLRMRFRGRRSRLHREDLKVQELEFDRESP